MTKNTEIEKKLKRVQWIRTVINHHLNDVEDTITPLPKPMSCEIDDSDLFENDLGMP